MGFETLSIPEEDLEIVITFIKIGIGPTLRYLYHDHSKDSNEQNENVFRVAKNLNKWCEQIKGE